MSGVFHEFILGGVLVAPLASYVIVALALMLLIRPLLRLIGFSRYFARPQVVEIGLFVIAVGLVTLFH